MKTPTIPRGLVPILIGSACFWSWYDMAFFNGVYLSVGLKTYSNFELAFSLVIFASILVFTVMALRAEGFDRIVRKPWFCGATIGTTLVASAITSLGSWTDLELPVYVGSFANGIILGIGYEMWGIVYASEGAKSANRYVPLSIGLGVVLDCFLLTVNLIPRVIFTTFLPVISIVAFLFILLNSKTAPPVPTKHKPFYERLNRQRYIFGIRPTILFATLVFVFAFTYMEQVESYSLGTEGIQNVSVFLIARGVAAFICYLATFVFKKSPYVFYRFGILIMIGGFLLMPVLNLESILSLIPGILVMAGYTCYDVLLCIIVSEIAFCSGQSSLRTFGLARLVAQGGVLLGLLVGILFSQLFSAKGTEFLIVTTGVGYLLVIASVIIFDKGSGYWAMLHHGTIASRETQRSESAPDADSRADGTNRYRLEMLGFTYSLTVRELEIVGELMEGRSAPSIAERFCISENTVRSHMRNIYEKLNIHNKQEMLNLIDSISTQD